MQVVNCSFECFSPRHSKKQRNPDSLLTLGDWRTPLCAGRKAHETSPSLLFGSLPPWRRSSESLPPSEARWFTTELQDAGDVEEGTSSFLLFFIHFQIFTFSLIYAQENLVGNYKRIDYSKPNLEQASWYDSPAIRSSCASKLILVVIIG
jgi:hypothetical protein